MRFIAACLQHGSSLMKFFVQYGILFAPGVSVFSRNINTCAARYKFKVSNFLPRELCSRGICYGRVSVCLCVCLSVTSQSSTKTAKRRMTQTTPHDSPGTLVF